MITENWLKRYYHFVVFIIFLCTQPISGKAEEIEIALNGSCKQLLSTIVKKEDVTTQKAVLFGMYRAISNG